jgi:hypothetical protein
MALDPSRKEETRDAARHGLKFVDSESFGLFMEGLRCLKGYTQESEKDSPNPDLLKDYLDEALFRLGKCEASYPTDILPLYMLGIALTMKNQILYAQMLLEYGTGQKLLPRLAPTKTVKTVKLVSGPGAQPAAEPSQVTKHQEVILVDAEYLPRPADRPWPLLDHAEELFRKVVEAMETGPPGMQTSAKFNLAHIYSKRDLPGDLERAGELLEKIQDPLGDGKSEESTGMDFRSMMGGKGAAEAERLWWRSRTADRNMIRTDTATAAVSKVEKDIDAAELVAGTKKKIEATDLPSAIKTDLKADCWTKAGFIGYEQAFALTPEKAPREFDEKLKEAEDYLREALELKSNWNPAQIYLAQVLQAQGRVVEAAKYLEAVIGKPASQSAS